MAGVAARPAAAFGPYWAALVATLGLGGYLTSKLHLERPGPVLLLAVTLAATSILLATSNSVTAVAIAQTVLQLVAIVAIHAGLLLHDAVPPAIRTGVSSGVGTLSWVLFLPFSLVLGWLTRAHGVHLAGWVLLGVTGLLALLLTASTRRQPGPLAPAHHPEGEAMGVDAVVPTDVACRDLVALITDYLDGTLPADWRGALDRHLALVRVADAIHGTGGTAEVATVDALERSVKYLPRWHTFSAPTTPRDSYDQLRGEGETA